MINITSNILEEITTISDENEAKVDKETKEFQKTLYSLQQTTVKYVLFNNLFIPAMEIKSIMSGNSYTNLMEGWIVIKYYNEQPENQNDDSFEMDIKEKIDCLQSLTNENNAIIIGIFGNKMVKFTVYCDNLDQIEDYVFLGLELGLNHILLVKFDTSTTCGEANKKLDQESIFEFSNLSNLIKNIREILEPTNMNIQEIIDKLGKEYQIQPHDIEHIKLEDLYWKDSSINEEINEKRYIFYTVKEYLIGTLLFAKGPIWGFKLANIIYFVDMTTLCGQLLFNFEDGFI